ncbi:hypothetical protein [Haliangium ochraceum]|uniref:Uncharacterized protein n=1 Tax=Haliangium ochraceum (strain DSM 14365 / JCM 11303 / SMP-2) TaxID=502025 RepID=D0LWS3_HALO1|nr:hypothetical protein [Haliangium ochraceum]ACY14170.1 hypothetical protein Hoch_1620 [Haliangium ochraceum DSM 14365]
MATFSPEDVLVLYEYVSKPAKQVSVNYRWAVLADGRYFISQNPESSVRPDDFDSMYYFNTEWRQQTTLSEEQVAQVRELVAKTSLPGGRLAPAQPTPRGDLARLTLRGPEGEHVLEVEDSASEVHEQWIGQLLQIVGPQLAAAVSS